MPKYVTLHPQLSTDDVEQRYRSAHEPHERIWWQWGQTLWLLSRGQSARQVAHLSSAQHFTRLMRRDARRDDNALDVSLYS